MNTKNNVESVVYRIGHYSLESIEMSNDYYRASLGLNKHSRAHEIRKVVGEETWDSYETVAFVRNPYARTVSFYTWIRKLVRDEKISRFLPYSLDKRVWQLLPYRLRKRRETFRYSVTKAFLETRCFSDFIRHPGFASDYGCQPQVNFVTDPASGVPLVDFIGKVERLEEDIIGLGKRIGVEPLIAKRSNVSRSSCPIANFFESDDDVKFINQLYAADFEFFNYSTTLND